MPSNNKNSKHGCRFVLAGMCGNLEMVKDILTWRDERVKVRDKTDKRLALFK